MIAETIASMGDGAAIWLALFLPLAGAAGIALTGRIPNLREAVTMSAAPAAFAVVALALLPKVLAGEVPATAAIPIFGPVALQFAVEPLGMLFAVVASGLWIVNSIYSIGYMRANGEPRQTSFYVCFATAIFAALGIAFAGNLFTLFLFYEILTISTWPLVVHKADKNAVESGRIYLILLISTSMALLLPAIVWTYAAAGSADFVHGGLLAGAGLSSGLIGLLLFLYVFGIGKAAVMPVHFWLPVAMVAPTPVSALLHAVAVVKAGVFSIVKVIVYVFGVDFLAQSGAGDWLAYVAGFTIVAASLIALAQNNLKRLLAFSTVSQLSYAVLATAVLAPVSIVGAVVHIAAHAVSKITLFFAAGAIYTAARLTDIDQLDGIGRRMPWTMGAFAVGALGMIGLPPTAGFVSKWFMLTGSWQAENWFALGVVVLSTGLNAAYFLPVLYRAFRRPPPAPVAGRPEHGEAPAPMVIALTATAGLTVAMFFFPDLPVALAVMTMEGP